jgi:kumamolisin
MNKLFHTKSISLISRPIGVLSLLVCACLALSCGTKENEFYIPACGATKITFNPATGERISGPAEVELDSIPNTKPEDLPDNESTRVNISDGLWRLTQDVRDDGEPDPNLDVRILISLPMQKRNELNEWLERIYDPQSEVYLNFMSASCFTAEHGATAQSISMVRAFLIRHGLSVDRIAANRLLMIASGPLKNVESAFQFTGHHVTRVQRPDFATEGTVSVPDWLSPHIAGFLAMQDNRTNSTPRDDEKPIENSVYESGVTPFDLADVYGIRPLYNAGYDGRGQSIAVVVGWDSRRSDVASYFAGYGIDRAGSIDWRYVDAIPELYAGETTIDIEMAGGAAPGADLIVYLGADNTDFSLTWAINEAIGEGRASILTYSYSHQEVITAWELQQMQSQSARIGAALGITFFAASGDSRNVDNPSNSSWVTAVGATYLIIDENGERVAERDTAFGGLGRSALFSKPEWQRTIDPESDRRAVVDLALHCNPFPEEDALSGYIFGKWLVTGGTSLAAPMMAGYMAVLNQARGEKGQLGFINRALYTNPELQATFYDVTEGVIDGLNRADVGWDLATGWGAPYMEKWLETIP